MLVKRIQEVDVCLGSIIDGVKEMISLAEAGDFIATHGMNGVTVLVNGDSDPNLILRDQQRAQLGYMGDYVGPYPEVELSAKDVANDERIRAKNESRCDIKAKKERIVQECREKKFFVELETCPAMKRDEVKWQEGIDANNDMYGSACYTFAEYWARLMQKEISEGKNLKDIVNECSSKADIPLHGITGFMYGCAVSILAECWEYGEELRRWHNKSIQIGCEGDIANRDGGVLNPALLLITH